MLDIVKEAKLVEMIRQVFNHMADGVLVADIKEHKFCACNPAMCRITGYTEQELMALSVPDLHPENDLPYVVDQFVRQALKEFTLAKDIPVKRKEGSVFYADVNSVPMTFEGRDYLVGIFRDITERREKEEMLKASQERLRVILDAIPDLVFRLDAEGRFVDYKAELISQLFVPPDQFLGKCYEDVLPVEVSQRMTAAIEDALETGKVQTFEYHLILPGSGLEEQSYEARLIAIKGEYCVAICRNITEKKSTDKQLKKASQELKARKKDLEQKNVALKEVLAQVESEKMEIKRQVSANVSKFILPILSKLENSAGIIDKKQIVMLENGLKTLTSQFGTRISSKAPSLSAREIEVCNMIRSGLATKEIAQIMKVSLRTVDTYRNRIRKKMGISSRDVNLFAYLQKMT
ncbi:MAG: hypothetical protein A2283_07630 [Lentisphaerae bacterium RIFOXYA12_FULL_48_11]|nr:MAG: hypothetical protein A2283_07630 [Lentisphaerae bacterium RIFOXYA12_FULL_48_11]